MAKGTKFNTHQVCSNDDPGLTLTYFTARSNLVPFAIVWGKGKTKDFSESWSYDQDRLNKLSFPYPMETPYEIWLQSTQ